jgi:hypothetical protein
VGFCGGCRRVALKSFENRGWPYCTHLFHLKMSLESHLLLSVLENFEYHFSVLQKPAIKCLFPLRVSRFLQNRKPTYKEVKKSANLVQNEEVFWLNRKSWFPANFNFPQLPKTWIRTCIGTVWCFFGVLVAENERTVGRSFRGCLFLQKMWHKKQVVVLAS